MPVITNNVPRDTVDAWELTTAEREQFDYLDWPAIERGEDSATFVRYKGELLDLGTFMRDSCPPGWDGGAADSAFSGTVVRFVGERVIVGRVYS